MNISVKECSDADLPDAERKWQGRGFTLANKTDPKTLAVAEYMKSVRAAKSAGEATVWVLARRDPDQ